MNLDRASNIDGWMSGPELQFLASLAKNAKKILEIGSYQGRSTRALADNTDGIVYAVDAWNGIYSNLTKEDLAHEGFKRYGAGRIFREFVINLADHIKTGRVRVYKENFDEFRTNKKFDLIFIDAMHEYESVKHNILKSILLLEPGGIIAGHDYSGNWPGVIKAVDELIPNRRIQDSIWYDKL